MRLVLDANVVIPGLLWRGTPYRLLGVASVAPDLRLLTGAMLAREIRGALGGAKFAPRIARAGTSADDLVAAYLRVCEFVAPVGRIERVVRDPDDDHVLALALAGRADVIVSGDADLTKLEQWRGIRIATPAQALAMLEKSTP